MKSIVSTFLVTVILVGTLIVALGVQPGRASGTIYIRDTGEIDPPDAPISIADFVTYYFTDNIYDSIVVERSSIIIDGKGYTVQGSGSGNGFYLSGINNVTIKNMEIKNFWIGLRLEFSSNNMISGNNITNNRVGISINFSDENRVYHNNFINNLYQAAPPMEYNAWDDGYPSGGNYWSDHSLVDLYKGPYQNETGGDGVCDNPYSTGPDNQDRYPLMKAFGGPAGDVDGDRKVDMRDIGQMARIFGVKYPDPRYDRLCDVDLDGSVGMRDIGAAARNFEKSW